MSKPASETVEKTKRQPRVTGGRIPDRSERLQSSIVIVHPETVQTKVEWKNEDTDVIRVDCWEFLEFWL